MIGFRRGARGPRRPVTGRALVLGTVIVLLLVLLASPLSHYFASRGALSDAAAQLRDDRQQFGLLNRRLAQWQDPGFVQQQARRRLEYAMPGDTVYVVVGRGAQNDIDKTSGVQAPRRHGSGWNTRLWTSVQNADAAKQ